MFLLWLACSSSPSPAPVTLSVTERAAVPVEERAHTAVALARVPLSSASLPERMTAPQETTIRVTTPFKRKKREGGTVIYSTPIPVDPHLFPGVQAGARSFGNYDPPGLEISDGQGRLSFRRYAAAPRTWGYDHKHLLIGLPKGSPAPSEVSLIWPKALAAEQARDPAASGQSAEASIPRTVVLDTTTHHGLMLPTPSTAEWQVTVPTDGVLSTRARVLPPVIRRGETTSDATVELSIDGSPTERIEVPTSEWTDVRWDLSMWSGKNVTLTLSSASGDTTHRADVFLEDPTLYTPTDSPRRVVMLFLDTLRYDHLGVYGYERPTSPHLDQLASDAMVFEQARTIAPWTLPSARAVLSGQQPEQWHTTTTLPSHLAQAGFHVEGMVANAYLSPTFDMNRGFSTYRYDHLRPAPKTVEHGLSVLERHADRDVALYLQFMEAHLPYMEPKRFRGLFAGEKPEALNSVARSELVKLRREHPHFEAISDYVMARYDQNIAYLDDALGRLFDALPDDATIVVFADHGEEFWDHNNFEHGHTFYDELFRVPLIIRDPALQQGRFSAPASLLDITPTVMALQGLTPPHGPGMSLLSAANGTDDDSYKAIENRTHVFGRPLYGEDGWGAIEDGHKWIARAGVERAFNLVDDPQEHTNVGRPDAGPPTEALSATLGSDLVRVWRVKVASRKQPKDTVITLRHPSGITGAWKAYDPRGNHEATTLVASDGVLEITVPAGTYPPKELFVEPSGPATATTGLSIRLVQGETVAEHTVDTDVSDAPTRTQALAPTPDAWRVSVDLTWSPRPFGQAVEAWNEDLATQLEELGYVE